EPKKRPSAVPTPAVSPNLRRVVFQSPPHGSAAKMPIASCSRRGIAMELLLVAGIGLALCYLFGFANMFRFLIYGPGIGVVIGAIQVAVACQVWVNAGEPGFYFSAAKDISLIYALMMVGGGVVGVPFGMLLAGYERGRGRRIPLGR